MERKAKAGNSSAI